MKRARSLKIHVIFKLFSLLADMGHTIDTFIFRHLVALNCGMQILTYSISVEEEDPGDPYSCQALLASLSAPGDCKINQFYFPTCGIGYKGRMAATGASNGQ